MADFDPDKYLAEKAKSAPPAFDPDQYLAQKAKASAEPSMLDKSVDLPVFGNVSGRGVARGALGLLPGVGAGLGGGAGAVVGLPGGPIGAVAGGAGGAALGSAAGKSLEQMGRHYLLGENISNDKVASELSDAAKQGPLYEVGGKALGAAAETVAGTPLGQKVIGMLGKGAAKAGKYLTGTPESMSKEYAANGPAIDKMAEETEASIPKNTDAARADAGEKIQDFKNAQNKQIEDTIQNSGDDVRHDVTPIINSLEKEKEKYNAKANPEAIAAIDKLISRVKLHTPGRVDVAQSGAFDVGGGKEYSGYGAGKIPEAVDTNIAYGERSGYRAPEVTRTEINPEYGSKGEALSKMEPGERQIGTGGYRNKPVEDNTVSSVDLNRIKSMMQDIAYPSYMKSGQVFDESGPMEQAAKKAGATSREMLNAAHPEVAAANDQLSKLHDLVDHMNKNIISEKAPDVGLLAAGTGSNERNVENLAALDKLTGSNLLSDAKKIAAMRTFYKPSEVAGPGGGPIRKVGLLSGLGTAAGAMVGGPVGAAIGGGLGAAGGALSSPAAVKAAINSGRFTKEALEKMLSIPMGRQLLGRTFEPDAGKDK